MKTEFHQAVWDTAAQQDWAALLKLAIAEDLGATGDCTTNALVQGRVSGRAAVVARQAGVVAGLEAVNMTLQAIEPGLRWLPEIADGAHVEKGTRAGIIKGPAQGMLAAERVLLNLVGRLSGIATLTQRYVDAVAGTKARIYDTRKTTPGWRRLEKYAVRCGGGCNHRAGLYDAILIKDNHLALGARAAAEQSCYSPAEAVRRARKFAAAQAGSDLPMIVEIEVDTLEQLDDVLPAGPDIVLLDNMPPDMLRKAVARRDARAPDVELEASGGVNLQTVHEIAATGIDRISVGGLTHSAISLDFGLDWLD